MPLEVARSAERDSSEVEPLLLERMHSELQEVFGEPAYAGLLPERDG